jgi:hypothetical protein
MHIEVVMSENKTENVDEESSNTDTTDDVEMSQANSTSVEIF